MNDSKNSSNGLLVVKIQEHIEADAMQRVVKYITPLAEEMGLEPMVLDGGADASVSVDYSALLTRLCVAVERLVAQGEPPQLFEEIAPPALNQRATGLNSRDYQSCKGAWELGTACGRCERCKANRPTPPPPPPMRVGG